jgi:hypothetical protein
MRWTRMARLTSVLVCGRRSRVVLTSRRWRQASQKFLQGDGDNKARSPRRARRKPLKPSRAGMPGDPGATVVTNARATYSTRAAAGATGTRHSPRPLLGEGFRHNSGASRGEDADSYLNYPRHCERSEAIHSCFLIASWNLRFARNDDLLTFVIVRESGRSSIPRRQ